MYRQKKQEFCEFHGPIEYCDQHYDRDDKCEKKERDHDRCTLPHETVREIRAAIDDELGAVAEYATLARKFKKDPVMQAWITSIAGDEYGHARALSIALAAAGCADEKDKDDKHKDDKHKDDKCKDDKCKDDKCKDDDHKDDKCRC